VAPVEHYDTKSYFLQDVYQADMKSLYKGLINRIDHQELEECVNKIVGKILSQTGKCRNSFSEEQTATLKGMSEAIAYSICGQKMFKKTCV